MAGVIEIVQEARIVGAEAECEELATGFAFGRLLVDAHAHAGGEHAHAIPAVVSVDDGAMDFAGDLEIVGDLLIHRRVAGDTMLSRVIV